MDMIWVLLAILCIAAAVWYATWEQNNSISAMYDTQQDAYDEYMKRTGTKWEDMDNT